MQSSFDLTTLVFLGLAVFVAWKLRAVLGQKTGSEQPPVDPFSRRDKATPPSAGNAARDGQQGSQNGSNVIRLPGAANDASADAPAPTPRWAGIAEPGTPLAAGLDAIAQQEAAFDAPAFVHGATSAYEMIVTAFAQGDRKTLKGLLAKDVFDGFEQAITDREKRQEKAETTFVSMEKANLVGAEVKGRAAQLTIRFASKLISCVRDVEGKVIDGSAETIADVTDIWTFSRQLGSHDPNWYLAATEPGA